jgi:hypothetical protein
MLRPAQEIGLRRAPGVSCFACCDGKAFTAVVVARLVGSGRLSRISPEAYHGMVGAAGPAREGTAEHDHRHGDDHDRQRPSGQHHPATVREQRRK